MDLARVLKVKAVGTRAALLALKSSGLLECFT
jgi:hypothetical protein